MPSLRISPGSEMCKMKSLTGTILVLLAVCFHIQLWTNSYLGVGRDGLRGPLPTRHDRAETSNPCETLERTLISGTSQPEGTNKSGCKFRGPGGCSLLAHYTFSPHEFRKDGSGISQPLEPSATWPKMISTCLFGDGCSEFSIDDKSQEGTTGQYFVLTQLVPDALQ